MTSRWEKPGFEVLRVAGECTAYAGAREAGPRPRLEAGEGLATARAEAVSGGRRPAEAKAPAVD